MKHGDTDKLYVMLTMDVLPPEGPDIIPGADSWEDAERSLKGFISGVQDVGGSGTLFVTPGALERFADIVGDAESPNMEVGLLCHPQLEGYQSYLGSYSLDRQRDVLRTVGRSWEKVRGDRPETFRAGFFSANDYTYQALCLEGYRQGSCSLPGRIDLEQCCQWQKTPVYPHHTDPLNRKVVGTMEFYEVPVTSLAGATPECPEDVKIYTPPHLRIEDVVINEHAAGVIESVLDVMEEERVGVRSLLFVTHNAVGWGGGDDPHLERLKNLMELLEDIAGSRRMEVVPTTIKNLHVVADKQWNGLELDF